MSNIISPLGQEEGFHIQSAISSTSPDLYPTFSINDGSLASFITPQILKDMVHNRDRKLYHEIGGLPNLQWLLQSSRFRRLHQQNEQIPSHISMTPSDLSSHHFRASICI